MSDQGPKSKQQMVSDQAQPPDKPPEAQQGDAQTAPAATPPAAITTQPGAEPPGSLPVEFECWRHSEYVRIKQKLEWIEICCRNCCEQENRYNILDHFGDTIFEVKEESWCCLRCCLCGDARPMNLFLKDHKTEKQLMRIDRPWRPCSCICCCCCRPNITVYTPTDPEEVKLGHVEMICGCCRPRFMIYDSNNEPQLMVKGPCAPCNLHRQKCACAVLCCAQATFTIYRVNNKPGAIQHKDENGEMQYKDGEGAGAKVGEMRKEAAVVVKEELTDADNFTLTFEPELELNLKLLLIALTFLVDLLYYEKSIEDAPKKGVEG